MCPCVFQGRDVSQSQLGCRKDTTGEAAGNLIQITALSHRPPHRRRDSDPGTAAAPLAQLQDDEQPRPIQVAHAGSGDDTANSPTGASTWLYTFGDKTTARRMRVFQTDGSVPDEASQPVL
jgi:hypothetical protein